MPKPACQRASSASRPEAPRAARRARRFGPRSTGGALTCWLRHWAGRRSRSTASGCGARSWRWRASAAPRAAGCGGLPGPPTTGAGATGRRRGVEKLSVAS
ncbi:hypothetical protein CF640_37400, partial [Burkholderia pseudomallei]